MRATDHVWTLAAAQAAMRGLFPDMWLDEQHTVPQVFPVHVNQDKDDLLLLAPRNCPVYQYDLSEERTHSTAWKKLLNETAPLVQQLRAAFANTSYPPVILTSLSCFVSV